MTRFELKLVLCCQLGLAACGSTDTADGTWPYQTNRTAVIGRGFDNPDGLAHRGPDTFDSDECIELDGACLRPQEDCGARGVADVLVDDWGTVAAVICYPTRGVSIETVDGEVDHFGNNVVVVLDDDDDGIDLAGDVTIDGNNVVLYGHGPDVSVIGGDLNIAKNNAAVRGIHVAGDVTIQKNNASIVDCVIEGDLTIRGNNTSLALCDVWGTLTIEGNNTVLVSNFFASTFESHGNNTRCGGNRAFIDLDRDGRVSDDEVGDIIACSSSGKGENKGKAK